MCYFLIADAVPFLLAIATFLGREPAFITFTAIYGICYILLIVLGIIAYKAVKAYIRGQQSKNNIVGTKYHKQILKVITYQTIFPVISQLLTICYFVSTLLCTQMLPKIFDIVVDSVALCLQFCFCINPVTDALIALIVLSTYRSALLDLKQRILCCAMPKRNTVVPIVVASNQSCEDGTTAISWQLKLVRTNAVLVDVQETKS